MSAVAESLTDEVLDSVAELRGRPRTVEVLPGGLTNVNHLVTTPAGRYVVRHFHDEASGLAINREHEYQNSARAAAAGVGAPVIAFVPAHHILVVGYLNGRTLDNTDFQRAGLIPRAAEAVRRLHAGPPFVNEFNMFQLRRRYLATAQQRGYRLPTGYLNFTDHADRIEAALARDPVRPVPCNNDLLAANFIDDGRTIRLIDYEYSGNNDPCFELGNIWTECGLSHDQLDELVSCYYGRPDPQKLARAELQGLMSRYGWTLWGAIQASTSPIDYDFWSWGLERFSAAASVFTTPRFARLLEQAAGTP